MKRYIISLFSVLTFIGVSMLGALSFADIVDGIVAIVGEEIIMVSDLQRQLRDEMMRRDLTMQSSQNELLALREEVVQGMVDNLLLLEKARQDSLEIDMRDVDQELKARMAGLKERAGSEELYQEELISFGLTELELKNISRDMIVKELLRMRILQQMAGYVSVTPQEIEGWFVTNQDSLPEIQATYKLSHIFLLPGVSDERKKVSRDIIQGIKDRLTAGEDFTELAKQYSEDPGNAQNGGDLGYFNRTQMVPEFTEAAFGLEKSEVSDIVETNFGFHLIRVDDIRGDEIRARHILILLRPNEEDELNSIKKLNDIRDKIVSGEATFDEMARKYSEDENSRDLGGKLQWLGLNDFVTANIPSFKEQAEKLKIGEISEPFKSNSGFHIVKLDDLKPEHTLNIINDRSTVEELLKEKKTIDEYERILSDLRIETYIEVRL